MAIFKSIRKRNDSSSRSSCSGSYYSTKELKRSSKRLLNFSTRNKGEGDAKFSDDAALLFEASMPLFDKDVRTSSRIPSTASTSCSTSSSNQHQKNAQRSIPVTSAKLSKVETLVRSASTFSKASFSNKHADAPFIVHDDDWDCSSRMSAISTRTSSTKSSNEDPSSPDSKHNNPSESPRGSPEVPEKLDPPKEKENTDSSGKEDGNVQVDVIVTNAKDTSMTKVQHVDRMVRILQRLDDQGFQGGQHNRENLSHLLQDSVVEPTQDNVLIAPSSLASPRNQRQTVYSAPLLSIPTIPANSDAVEFTSTSAAENKTISPSPSIGVETSASVATTKTKPSSNYSKKQESGNVDTVANNNFCGFVSSLRNTVCATEYCHETSFATETSAETSNASLPPENAEKEAAAICRMVMSPSVMSQQFSESLQELQREVQSLYVQKPMDAKDDQNAPDTPNLSDNDKRYFERTSTQASI